MTDRKSEETQLTSIAGYSARERSSIVAEVSAQVRRGALD
jgi:hypothetical protein